MATSNQKQDQKSAILDLRRPDIGLADLITCLKHLNPQNPAQHQLILSSLGFSTEEKNLWQPYRPRQAAINHTSYQRVQRQQKKALPQAPQQRPLITQPPPSLHNPVPDTDAELKSLPDQTSTVTIPDFDTVTALDDVRKIALPRKQLMPRNKARAILSSAIATSIPGYTPAYRISSTLHVLA